MELPKLGYITGKVEGREVVESAWQSSWVYVAKKRKAFLMEFLWLLAFAFVICAAIQIYGGPFETSNWESSPSYIVDSLVASTTVLKWSFWIAVGGTFVFAFVLSRKQLDVIAEIGPRSVRYKFPGEDPTRPTGILKRIIQIRRRIWGAYALTYYRMILLVLVSGIVPALLLLAIAERDDWLFGEDRPAIVIDAQTELLGTVQSSDIRGFIIDQTLKGSANDFAEVFDINLGVARNNPSNWVFSFFVFLYRLLTGTAAVAIIYVFYRLFASTRKASKVINGFVKEYRDIPAS